MCVWPLLQWEVTLKGTLGFSRWWRAPLPSGRQKKNGCSLSLQTKARSSPVTTRITSPLYLHTLRVTALTAQAELLNTNYDSSSYWYLNNSYLPNSRTMFHIMYNMSQCLLKTPAWVIYWAEGQGEFKSNRLLYLWCKEVFQTVHSWRLIQVQTLSASSSFWSEILFFIPVILDSLMNSKIQF